MYNRKCILYKQKYWKSIRKLKKSLGKAWSYFPNTRLNLTPSLQKEFSILSYIAKKIQARQYLQNCFSQPGMCKKT